MIEQNFIEKLLDGVKVEWSVLGDEKFVEIANSGRKPVKASERISGDIPYYGANNIQDYVEGFTHDGVYVLIAEDGTASIENYSIQWATGKFWANNHVHVIRGIGSLNSRFLFHYLRIVNFVPYLSGGGRAKLTKGEMIKIPIPIPPLKVQEEIVRILDTFTELTAELTAELTTELTARKKQYNYYRDKLLSFEDGQVEWKSLGEVVHPTSNIKWKDNKSTYQYIDLSSVCREKNIVLETCEINAENAPSRAQKIVLENDIIFATTRPTQQRLCLITKEFSGEIASTGYCVLRPKQNLALSKWIYHNMTTLRFKNYVEENQSGSAYPAISDAKVKEFMIPIPQPSEQEKLISILNNIEESFISISDCLSSEIELRQKQYEYYRNMLLSFPKEEVER